MVTHASPAAGGAEPLPTREEIRERVEEAERVWGTYYEQVRPSVDIYGQDVTKMCI